MDTRAIAADNRAVKGKPMLEAVTDLSLLHDLHLKLQDVNEELASGPRQIMVREKRVAAAKQQVTNREAELKAARKLADQKSLDLKSREAKVADLTAKLNQSTSNKEYEAIKSQIAADKAASAVLEDESLEALERVDATIELLAQDKQAVTTTEEQLAKYKAEFAERKLGLDARAAELKQKIQQSETLIPAGHQREKYQRLAATQGADAMASVDEGGCSGCYTQIPMQNRILLNQNEIVFCGSCGRLLYKQPEPHFRG